MNYKVYYCVLIILIGIVSYNAFPSVIAQANNTSNIFTDSKSGVSFHYPSDWRIASKEYTNKLYGNPVNSNASINNIHIRYDYSNCYCITFLIKWCIIYCII